MPTEEELIQERMRKLADIEKAGINPYPYNYEQKNKAEELQQKYSSLHNEQRTNETAKIAGRIIGLRRMGKATFVHVIESTGKIQVYLQFDKLGEKQYLFLKLLDIGDIVGVEGTMFKTKTGEITVDATKLELLSKSLRSLPEKWHGLKDIEARYRKRYVDLIMNPEVKEVFRKRTKIIDSLREFLNEKKFLEVDTPVLQPIYGGANAKPFKTHLNSLKMDVFLRISPELYLKRLIVGGLDKVYEFSKNFRNEDIDKTHNPEFTSVEIYQAYADFNDMMQLTEDAFVHAVKKLCETTKIEYQGKEIDFKKPWQSYTMVEAIRKFAEINLDNMSDKEIFDLRITYNLEIKGDITKGKIIQALFEELVEAKLIQPTFITHHPVESTPLCKECRDTNYHGFIERFELFIVGMEFANAYSELNNPIVQRKLLEQQAKELRAGAEEAHPMDEDFVESLEYAMPPTGGVGIGIDRMIMILTNQPSIKDVILFPFVKNILTIPHTIRSEQKT
ncbi:lysine--tRNA ligase [Candidatus Woesearchaeota archaeon]|nr:lysine--tRNA ligase [Candidatus Woesearchaeota archaeon]